MKTPKQLRDLADAIEAHERGEDIQIRPIRSLQDVWALLPPKESPRWYDDVLYRPAPQPVTRPWSKPEDVPMGACIRHAEKTTGVYFPTSICDDGIAVYYKTQGYFFGWETLARFYEYSTDRVTWKKCEVTE